MTLENLLSIGRLKSHKGSAVEIRRLLASAEAALADAKRGQNSPATRFDMGYKAIMQCSLAERMMILDGFRRARNLSDYEGEPVEDAKVRECVEWASALLANVREWIAKNHPELL
jgi:hypothetical protein